MYSGKEVFSAYHEPQGILSVPFNSPSDEPVIIMVFITGMGLRPIPPLTHHHGFYYNATPEATTHEPVKSEICAEPNSRPAGFRHHDGKQRRFAIFTTVHVLLTQTAWAYKTKRQV